MKSYLEQASNQLLERLAENVQNFYLRAFVGQTEPPKPFRPCIEDKVVNTTGALIGYIRGVWMPRAAGAFQLVWVGKQVYKVLEWDRSWAAWIAYGRGR